MASASLRQIYDKLEEIDMKVSALMVKEEKPSKNELRAIKMGEKEFSAGKFKSLKEVLGNR